MFCYYHLNVKIKPSYFYQFLFSVYLSFSLYSLNYYFNKIIIQNLFNSSIKNYHYYWTVFISFILYFLFSSKKFYFFFFIFYSIPTLFLFFLPSLFYQIKLLYHLHIHVISIIIHQLSFIPFLYQVNPTIKLSNLLFFFLRKFNMIIFII